MKKIIFNVIIATLVLTGSSLFANQGNVLFAHIDSESEKLVEINQNPNIADGKEVLIISEHGIKINRSGKYKGRDNTLCTNKKLSDEDVLCRSIFGTSTSAEAIANNSTYGVLGNSIMAVISLGVVPAVQGLTFYVYEDTDKLNEFIKSNNLDVVYSNFLAEKRFKQKYSLVADSIIELAYNDVGFTQKLNEQVAELDKKTVVALKAKAKAEEDAKVARAKAEEDAKVARAKAEEDAKVARAKAEEEEEEAKVARAKAEVARAKAEEEAKVARAKAEVARAKAEQKIAEAKRQENDLFKKVEKIKVDGFGDKTKVMICSVADAATNNAEIAKLYASTWGNKLFNQGSLGVGNINIAVHSDVVNAGIEVISYNYGKLTINNYNVQAGGTTLKTDIDFRVLGQKLTRFVFDSDGNLAEKKTKLIQAVLASSGAMVYDGKTCRYWPKNVTDIEIHITHICAIYKQKPQIIKFLSIFLSGLSEDEIIRKTLELEGVKEIFEILLKK